MDSKNHNLHNLFKALHNVYLRKESVPTDPQFKNDLMRQIRRLDEENPRGSFFQKMGLLTWKLAPVTILMILICSYILMNFEFILC